MGLWIVFGMVVGFVAGAAIDDFETAAIGALAGGVIGAAIGGSRRARASGASTDRLAEAERKLDHIYGALEHIHHRLEAIEKQLAVAPPPLAEFQATRAAPDAATAPVERMPEARTRTSFEKSPAMPPSVAADAEAPGSAPGPLPEATVAPAGAARRPRPVQAPRPPSAILQWFFGGNTVVRVGVVILFFGVAFLVKYAAENFAFPIELRLAGVAAGGLVMLAIGWGLREKRPGYGLTLQGGAVGVLYLTVFAAYRLYALLPAPLAFGLLVAIAAASSVLALRQNAPALAMLAAAGGFLAPILASTGAGSHVALFGYYVVLNMGILAIAWFRAWRGLNLLGFVFTFAIAALWGARFYRPEHFATTEPFLVVFFLMYLGITLLFATRRAAASQHYVDGTLVFGVPLVAFGLQSRLVRDTDYGLAFSALVLAAIYLMLARALWSRRQDGLRLLVESFLALGVVFATLAIPLALDGRWTSAAWALEGAAVVWAGGRQGRRLAQWFGLALQPAAALAFVHGNAAAVPTLPVANSVFLGCLFLAVAGLFCARQLDLRPESLGRFARWLAWGLFLWGAAWWCAGGLHEIDRFVAHRFEIPAAVAFLALTAGASLILRTRLDWRIALVPAALLVPAMVLAAMVTVLDLPHPLAHYGFVAWPLAFAVAGLFLRRHETELPRAVGTITHVVAAWLAVALACWEAAWWIDRAVGGHRTWPFIAWALVPGLALAGLTRGAKSAWWPFAPHRRTYLVLAAAPVAAYLWGWIFVANAFSDGSPAPLPYVPVVNPLDVACALVLVVLGAWYQALCANGMSGAVPPQHAAAALGIAAFAWLNGILLRTLHHWAAVPYDPEAMMRSTLVQTSLSVFWTVLALAAMVIATRKAWRPLWFTGGALLAVVVLKLFVFDLSRLAGLERIVSFLVVGILLLAVGYFSPVPPRRAEVRP